MAMLLLLLLMMMMMQGDVTMLKMDVESGEWDVMRDIMSSPGLLESFPQVTPITAL
jgi:hypothetical protein